MPLLNVQELLNFVTMHSWTSLPSLPPQYLATPPVGRALPGVAIHQQGGGATNTTGDATVQNPLPVPTLVNWFTAHNQPLQTLMARNASILPKADNGEQLCLSWHCWASCNENCHCKNTHCIPSPMEENNVGHFLDVAGVAGTLIHIGLDVGHHVQQSRDRCFILTPTCIV